MLSISQEFPLEATHIAAVPSWSCSKAVYKLV